MSTDIEVRPANGVVVADEWNRERIELIKRTYCKDATDDELNLFIGTAKRTGLSPEARQIFAVKRWDNSQRREVMAVQTSIDGYRLVAQRSREYGGQIPKQWCGEDGKWVDVWLKKEPPAAAKAGVYRAGFAEPLVCVATWAEYAQTKKDGSYTAMWARMPALMLAKCAESLALRAAFPAELSGLYTAEEMGQAESPPPVPPLVRRPPPNVDADTGEVTEAKTVRRPPPTKAPSINELVKDHTVKLLVDDLNAISDPEVRREAKAEFMARFGKPEELKAEQYEEARQYVATVAF